MNKKETTGGQFLNSQLFQHGTRFRVTERTEDTTITPGSTGFISFIRGYDQDFQNVAYFVAVLTRKGKTGKERLEKVDFSAPIFEIEGEGIAKFMPDEKRKCYIHIEGYQDETSLVEMPAIDFLAWGLSVSAFIHKLNSKAKYVKPWPRENEHVLNKFLKMNEIFSNSDNPNGVKAAFAEKNLRQRFIRDIRLMESTLVKGACFYLSRIAMLEAQAMADLLRKNPKKEPFIDEKVLNETMALAVRKRDKLEKLAITTGPNSVFEGGVEHFW